MSAKFPRGGGGGSRTFFSSKSKYFLFFFFASKTDIFMFRYIFWKCLFCYFIDNRALSYYKNDVHIVNISNGNII